MEVLPAPAQFSTSLPPPLFTNCMNATTVSQNPSTPPQSSIPASLSHCADHSLRFARTPSPTKTVIGGFLPLPTIIASPVCPTTPSFHSVSEAQQSQSQLVTITTPSHDSIPTKDTDRSKDKTPPNSCSLRVLFAAPTWISTPPTPPQKNIRHSSYGSRKPMSPISPSASFPALTRSHTIVDNPTTRLKRCLSVPVMSPRPRTISDPSLSFNLSPACFSESFHDDQSQAQKHSNVIFQLPSDGDDCSSVEYAPSLTELSPAASRDEHTSVTDTTTREIKDAMRIFHALQELLSSEVDYVRDLRILHIAYIQRLSTFEVRASAFARASASFSTGPWVNAYAGQTLMPADVVSSSSSFSSMRPVFSEREIELLTGNLDEILQIHEGFVYTLQEVMSSLGLVGILHDGESSMSEPGDFSTFASVLEAVSRKFVTEAPKFQAYQKLVAEHPEAIELVRRVMEQHPPEWEAFEHRCWDVASKLDAMEDSQHIFDLSRNKQSDLLNVPLDEKVEQKRRRTMPAISPGNKPSPCTKDADRTADSRQPRLGFKDYLIKPVQRICRYPLLLQQLIPKGTLFQSDAATVVAIQDAIQVMRGVAFSVDEARHKREAITKSSLIISRFVLSPSSPSPSPNSSATSASPVLGLTPAFLSSLGPCLLSGALDVMYYSPRQSFGQLQTITAKYLGVFLYSGGYLILAKIYKGKKYEPRHWFALSDFAVTGVEGDEAMLPCAFRLSSKTIHFEFAAACQREKDIWLEAISFATKQEPVWITTPFPSFKAAGKGIRSSELWTDGLTATSLTCSVPDISDTETSTSTSTFRTDNRRRKLTLRKSDVAALQDHSRLSNRRSSTASIKSIFAPMGLDPDSIYINRSMISGRLQVDHELQDVASQVCLEARLQARVQAEVLFPQPSQQFRERSAFSRSNSAISVAGLARNRLSKQESLRVPRRKPRCDSMTAFEVQSLPDVPALPLSARRSGKTFSLQALPPRMMPADQIHVLTASSTSTTTTSFWTSPATSPLYAGSSPLSRPTSPMSLGRRGSKLALVRSVKGLFNRSSPQSPRGLLSDDADIEKRPPLMRRFTLKKTSFRRRSRSVAPDEELPVPN